MHSAPLGAAKRDSGVGQYLLGVVVYSLTPDSPTDVFWTRLGRRQYECEGDLVMAAEKVTPADVNFMVRHARGVVSVALPEKRTKA
jgi:hypothetical protein